MYFTRINTQNGLSHNKVNCIRQDRRGFIWIGTDDGLNRYDGRYFTIFRNTPGDTTTISGNIITSLLEDKEGIVWIGTADGGMTKYDYRQPANRQFRQYKHVLTDSLSIPVNIINALQEDNYGYLWIATSDHYVLRFNKKMERFTTVAATGPKTALSLCLDGDTIWAGRQGGGVIKINTRTLAYSMDKRYDDLYASLPHVAVTALYKQDSAIWMGSWDRVLYRYNKNTLAETAFTSTEVMNAYPGDQVLSFAESGDHRLWIGGREFGLTIYDSKNKSFQNYRYNAATEGTIADKQINTIYRDRTGLMWLGTNRGISIYDPGQQPFVQTFLPKSGEDMIIYDFFKEHGERLWLATSAGIYTRNHDKEDFVLRNIRYNGAEVAVTRFFADAGKWYIGTNVSLFEYDTAHNTIAMLPTTEKDSVMNRIIESRVVSIVKDSIDGHPVIIVSPYGHYLAYYDLAEKKWVSRTNTAAKIVSRFRIKDNLIRKFYKTRDGNLWVAGAKSGLGVWAGQKRDSIRYLQSDPSRTGSISNDNVYDLREDVNGNLWVSTFGGGLNYYDISKGIFTHAPATNNLLEGIQLDEKRNVWGISNGNIYRYNPYTKTNTDFALPDLEKSGGVKGNVYKDEDGYLYVAGTNYFIRFSPAEVKDADAQPAVYFTDFKIFNASYPELLTQEQIPLRYFQNYFTIEFSAPQYTGSAVEYSYRLQGFDKDWNQAGSRNVAYYSNLPGGEYTFTVRATSKKGNWGNELSVIHITIIPPFWQRWWFYLLCAAFVVTVVYIGYRYRISELLKRQAMRNKIAQDLHDNMGSTLSSISVYSQVAKIYQQQNKENMLLETIDKMGNAAGEMISEMSDIVWAINPKNDSLGMIIQRMESFAKPLIQAKEVMPHFNYDISSADVHMQMNKRKNFYLIFKECINNALKYSLCKNIEVTVTQHNQTIGMSIKDDGIGFDIDGTEAASSQSLSGNGLRNMHMRANEMGATLSFNSTQGKGTSLHLSFHIP